jgi:hypothetical protein
MNDIYGNPLIPGYYWATDVLDDQYIVYVNQNQYISIHGHLLWEPISVWKDFVPVINYRDTLNINLKVIDLLKLARH